MDFLAFEYLRFVFHSFRWVDILDIIAVWFVVYHIFVLVRKTGSLQILSGLGVVAFIYLMSIWFELYAFNWLMEKFFNNLFLILVVLFQGEIRRALAQFGTNPFVIDASDREGEEWLSQLLDGVSELLKVNRGALIVIERELFLDYHLELGTILKAQISAELLMSLFHPQSPIHDGAVLIRKGKIYSAGNFLPLSKNPFLDKTLGTRHRAAVGLSEETDALVIVISEETNRIAVAKGGQLEFFNDVNELRRFLYYELKPMGV
ncbi:MAG: diadenylate cyclase CdaA [Bdellovibrionaceae bacterium]|nr:diadenylate cyclase CdaA [Pseudobdellovibrionaceae bacterium]MDW8191195.1 diadenylate cyclase CdaA [Pseudobdellovibrionaceae bacterium]